MARFSTFSYRSGSIKWRIEGRSQNSAPLCRKLSRARNLTFFSVLVYRTPDFRLGAGLAFLTQKGCHIVRQKSSKSRPLQNPCPCPYFKKRHPVSRESNADCHQHTKGFLNQLLSFGPRVRFLQQHLRPNFHEYGTNGPVRHLRAKPQRLDYVLPPLKLRDREGVRERFWTDQHGICTLEYNCYATSLT